jgi:hypothetical protein
MVTAKEPSENYSVIIHMTYAYHLQIESNYFSFIFPFKGDLVVLTRSPFLSTSMKKKTLSLYTLACPYHLELSCPHLMTKGEHSVPFIHISIWSFLGIRWVHGTRTDQASASPDELVLVGCSIDNRRRTFRSPISVTKRHNEHLTAGAPKGYINNVAQCPQCTLPTSWAATNIGGKPMQG